MSLKHHVLSISLLMAGATIFLSWLATHTEVMFADGLRYVALAQAIEQGSWNEVLNRAEDHPAYPLAIAAAHRLRGGTGPDDWQAAGQAAAVAAGVLLVIPLYLLALELYGAETAWLACVLFYLVPLTGHVLADVLSEGTFLLFWTTGCWTALRFLRQGSTPWLLGSVALAALAYLTRPEGALLPVALAGTLAVLVIVPSLRLPWPAWRRAAMILMVGPLLLSGPYVLAKGGIGTKPARWRRLLGLASRSDAMAVERERPLDPGQSTAATYRLATGAVMRAIVGAVSAPLVALAVAGLFVPGLKREWGRPALFMVLCLSGWLLALVRLHATGGYCTPRHALIFAIPVIAAAAHGLQILVKRAALGCSPARLDRQRRLRTGLVSVCLVCLTAVDGRDLLAPINAGSRGYREAGEWLAANTPRDSRILDLKGWATFYGQRSGYSFGEITQAQDDPNLGWIVTHDAHLAGPWFYCQTLRKLVGDRRPIVSFPKHPRPSEAHIHIFELRRAWPGTGREPIHRRSVELRSGLRGCDGS